MTGFEPAATVCGARTARRALRADPRAFSTAAPTKPRLYLPPAAARLGDLVPHRSGLRERRSIP